MPRPVRVPSSRFVAVLTLALGASLSGLGTQRAAASVFTSESAFQAAAGGVNLQTFDSFAAGTQLTSLPGLGISFGPLTGGVFPSVEASSSGFGGTNFTPPNVLFNAVQPQLPGLGPIVLLPLNSNNRIFAVGYWNTGGDDSTTIRFFDANNNLLESGTLGTSGLLFLGIVNPTGAARVEIDAGPIGNGFFSIDNLQVRVAPAAVTAVPEPVTFAVVGLLALGAAGLRRRKATA